MINKLYNNIVIMQNGSFQSVIEYQIILFLSLTKTCNTVVGQFGTDFRYIEYIVLHHIMCFYVKGNLDRPLGTSDK